MYRRPAVSWAIRNNSAHHASVSPDSSCANAAAVNAKASGDRSTASNEVGT